MEQTRGEFAALITGASAGIGRAIALELASAGYPLVLVARDADRLEGLAGECRERYDVEVLAVPCDLTAPDALERVRAAITDARYEIGLLVNNAGFGVHGAFAQTDLENESRLMTLQLQAALALT